MEEALGPFRFIAYILKKRFETYKLISSLKYPLLVIHGNKDPLVSMAHGEKIYLLSTVSDKHFSRREGCTHVGYDRDLDIAHPIADFMKQFKISSSTGIDGLPMTEDDEDGCLFSLYEHLKQN